MSFCRLMIRWAGPIVITHRSRVASVGSKANHLASIGNLCAMATDKRARQRANREVKRQEQAKADYKRQRMDIIKRYAGYTVIFAIALILLKVLFG